MCRCCRPPLPCPLCLGQCGGASLERGQGPASPVTARQVRTPHSRAGRGARGLDVPGAKPLGLPLLALPGTKSPEVEHTALPAAWLWSRVLMSPNVHFPTAVSGGTCVFSSGQEMGDVCQVLPTRSSVGGHFSISPSGLVLQLEWRWAQPAPAGVPLWDVPAGDRGWSPLGLEAGLCCLGLPLAESPWPWPRGYRIINWRLFPRLEADLSELQPWHH